MISVTLSFLLVCLPSYQAVHGFETSLFIFIKKQSSYCLVEKQLGRISGM